MTRIRATCPHCGEVDLRPADVELEIIRDLDGDVTDGSRYRFSCPTCADVVSKPADARIAKLLTSGGVAVTVRQDEAQASQALEPHPESPPAGPAFTYDDLLDFHLLLESDEWLRQLQHTG